MNFILCDTFMQKLSINFTLNFHYYQIINRINETEVNGVESKSNIFEVKSEVKVVYKLTGCI